MDRKEVLFLHFRFENRNFTFPRMTPIGSRQKLYTYIAVDVYKNLNKEHNAHFSYVFVISIF